MKKHMMEFVKRGLMAASGGPVVLAIIYGILGANGTVSSFTPGEVCMGILTVTLMAFIAAGASVVYSIERLPLMHATLIHAAALYVDYLLIYWLNAWIPRSIAGVAIFTLIYIAGYAVIWLCVITSIRLRINRLNCKLKEEGV